MVPKFALVCTLVAKLYVTTEFPLVGLDGVKWSSVLNASARNSSVRLSAPSVIVFETLISAFSIPGPNISDRGALPSPNEFLSGSTRLGALIVQGKVVLPSGVFALLQTLTFMNRRGSTLVPEATTDALPPCWNAVPFSAQRTFGVSVGVPNQ